MLVENEIDTHEKYLGDFKSCADAFTTFTRGIPVVEYILCSELCDENHRLDKLLSKNQYTNLKLSNYMDFFSSM